MKNKIIALLLCLAMAVSLIGCAAQAVVPKTLDNNEQDTIPQVTVSPEVSPVQSEGGSVEPTVSPDTTVVPTATPAPTESPVATETLAANNNIVTTALEDDITTTPTPTPVPVNSVAEEEETNVGKTAKFNTSSIYLYGEIGNFNSVSIIATSLLPEVFTIKEQTTDSGDVVWYYIDAENWPTDYANQHYVKASVVELTATEEPEVPDEPEFTEVSDHANVGKSGSFATATVTLHKEIDSDDVVMPDTTVLASFVIETVYSDGTTVWYYLNSDNWPADYADYHYAKASSVTVSAEEPDVEPEDGKEVTETLGSNTVKVNGTLPTDASVELETVSASVISALADVGIEGNLTYLDISLKSAGAKYQPESAVTVTVGGAAQSGDNSATVYHFFDDAEAIKSAIAKNTAIEFATTNTALQAELAAAQAATGKTDVIYYEILDGTISGTDVIFAASSFSTYVVATGSTENEVLAQKKQFIMDSGYDNTFYVMPGSAITFYAAGTKPIKNSDGTYTMSLGSATEWTVSGTITNVSYVSSTTAQKYTLNIPSNATGTGVITIKTTNDAIAKVTVKSKSEIVAQALKSKGNTDRLYEVYLGAIINPDAGLPGEPGVNDRTFAFIRKDLSVHTSSDRVDENFPISGGNPGNIIKADIANEPNFKTSNDGTGTLGLVDVTGELTKKYINLTEEQWNQILKNLATKESSNGPVKASDGVRLDSTNYVDYTILPYVVKLQTVAGYSWNIDCYVVPKSSAVSLSYNLNLPSERYTKVAVPATETKYISLTTTVSSAFGATGAQVELGDVDYSTNYQYKFVGWNTQANGQGTHYDSGSSITVTNKTTLYAQWAPMYAYQLAFDLKSGSGSFPTLTQDWKDGDSHTFAWDNEPTRTGYKFTGWSTNGDDNFPEIFAGTKSYTMTGDPGEEKSETLYACWDKLVTITYNVEGPTGCGTVKLNQAGAEETSVSETVGEATDSAVGATAAVSDSDLYIFKGWYDASGKQVSTNESFVPEKVDGKNVAATYTAKFEHRLTDLKITKTGISNLDINGTAESQSTIFDVKDASGNIVTTVAIHNNGSVIVKDLIIGQTYTIEERGSWSWRYSAATAEITLTNEEDLLNEVTVNNTRNNSAWLNGGNYAVNKFGSVG